MPEGRTGPGRLPPHAPAPEPRRTAPAPARAEAPVVDVPSFEDKSPPFSTSRADPTAPTAMRSPAAATPAPRSADRRPETQDEAAPRRIDDTALGAAIDRALDETDGSSAK